MSLSPLSIYKEFKDWLTINSGLKWSDSRMLWTKAIKDFFGKQALSKGFTPIYTESGRGKKEYLVDLVWKNNHPRRWLELVLESELSVRNKKGILEDFEKLIDVKSYLKVGIFHLNSNKEKEILRDMADLICKQIMPFKDEEYLVIFNRYDKDKKMLCLSAYNLDVKGYNIKNIHEEEYVFPL